MLERDGMPIQILIKQQVWNNCWTRNSYCLSFNKENEREKNPLKDSVMIIVLKKSKVILHFFTISARATSSSILHLLFHFSCPISSLIFWFFYQSFFHVFTNQKNIKGRILTFQKSWFYLLKWKPFKNDEKCFLFHLKISFRS